MQAKRELRNIYRVPRSRSPCSRGDLFPARRGGILFVGMPQRVIAELESLVVEILDLRESPFCLLTFDSLVAEERASRLSSGQQTEDGSVGPVRVSFPEIQPDSEPALRIYLELAVALDIAELARRGVIENEDNW